MKEREFDVKEKWMGCCEECGPLPMVSASSESEAIRISEENHTACRGNPLILVAFRVKDLVK